MKKKLIAIVVGAAAAMPALAMADMSIYGRAHVSVDFLDDGAEYSETNLSSNSSRLGFKGDHQINPNLNAFFQIEQEVHFGTDNGGTLNTRDTFVGLGGNFGAVRLGRFDSPFKAARGPANLFGDQVGDMRNLTRVGNSRFDERYDNTIAYTTPSMGGLTAQVAYSIHQDTFAEEDHESSSVSAALSYAAGPFEAAIAYESAEDETRSANFPTPALDDGDATVSLPAGEREGIRVAAAYKVMDPLKVVGFYQTLEHDSDNYTTAQNDALTADVYGLGAEFKIASNTALKGMWMTRDVDVDDRNSDMWVLGVEHKLDKAVRVYANYAVVDNEDNAALTPWGQARTATPSGTAGEEASGLSVGLRYDF